MCDNPTNDISNHPKTSVPSAKTNTCATTEEAATTDSEEYSSYSLRYRNFDSVQSSTSNVTLMVDNMTSEEENDNYYSTNGNISWNNIQIPIVGYEIMDERARFTVYKLKVENKSTGDFWYVFRRYTDFVRLCNRLRKDYPGVVQYLPRKRWLKNNFDPIFLEERISGLQTLVNAVLDEHGLIDSQEIQDFFCLNEPPLYSETSEESKAMFEAFEDTIAELRQQLQEKESLVDSLQTKVHSLAIENENLHKLRRNSSMKCTNCKKDWENLTDQVAK